MYRRGWIDDLREQPLVDVALAAGMQEFPGRSWGPCPCCGAEARGSHDQRRGPVGFRPDGRGWRCHVCHTTGDVVALVAAAATGQARPDTWEIVHSFAAGRGLCASLDGTVRIAAPRPRPARPPSPPPTRPPLDEVLAVWDSAVAVVDDEEVAAWCRSRGLDPMWIADYDLARATHVTVRLPQWAGTGGTWGEWRWSGHRLVVRAFDHEGGLASIHARYIRGDEPHAKGLWPRGCSMSGLVLCDSPSLLRLDLVDGYYPSRVIVAEGVPDWLTWATHYSDGDEDAPLVIGVTPGSWSQAVADRIPDGREIVIATHDDDAGNGYAVQIIETIRPRVRGAHLSALRIPKEADHAEIPGR